MPAFQYDDITVMDEGDCYSIHVSVEEGGWTKKRLKSIYRSAKLIKKSYRGLFLCEIPESAPRGHTHIAEKMGFILDHRTEHPKTGELVAVYKLFVNGINGEEL